MQTVTLSYLKLDKKSGKMVRMYEPPVKEKIKNILAAKMTKKPFHYDNA